MPIFQCYRLCIFINSSNNEVNAYYMKYLATEVIGKNTLIGSNIPIILLI